jgi:FtsP/CotA-like multicopper oxidase with cupredoxin domain
MTFNDTIPGPVIAVNQGDSFQLTLINKGEMIHSLDIHGIEGSDQALSGPIQPGQGKTWIVKATNAGVFVYHCDGDNLNGIWDHIASGMYGGIVVHSKDERKAAYLTFLNIHQLERQGADIQTKVEELEEVNQALRNRDKMKDDAIAQLSDQVMALTTRMQEFERKQQPYVS